MAFNVVYLAGGALEELPHPLFPKKVIPFTKGIRMEMPAEQTTFEAIHEPSVDVEFFGVKFAATGYADRDYWELVIDQEKLFETIYTKELPHLMPAGSSGLVYPVSAGTPIRFIYNNDSATSKTVWIELQMLK